MYCSLQLSIKAGGASVVLDPGGRYEVRSKASDRPRQHRNLRKGPTTKRAETVTQHEQLQDWCRRPTTSDIMVQLTALHVIHTSTRDSRW